MSTEILKYRNKKMPFLHSTLQSCEQMCAKMFGLDRFCRPSPENLKFHQVRILYFIIGKAKEKESVAKRAILEVDYEDECPSRLRRIRPPFLVSSYPHNFNAPSIPPNFEASLKLH